MITSRPPINPPRHDATNLRSCLVPVGEQMTDRYKSFPPRWNNILLPSRSKAAARAGVAMYAPCTSRGVWTQRAAWRLVSLGGAALLPGRNRPWQPPLPPDQWRSFLDEVSKAVGKFDSHAVYQRADRREGLLLLLLDQTGPLGLIKARADDHTGIAREVEALMLIERASISSFRSPRVITSGTFADWRYLVLSPMPPRPHQVPKGGPTPQVLDDIVVALSELKKSSEVPAHWLPCHGDFAPWNFRQIGNSTPWLIDWEDARWAPPKADAVLYRAAAHALGRSDGHELPVDDEATEFCRTEVLGRIKDKQSRGERLERFDRRLLEALSGGNGP